MNWMSNVERKQLQTILKGYICNGEVDMANKLEEMIRKLDEAWENVLTREIMDNYSICKTDYNFLSSIFSLYRAFITSVIQQKSITDIEDVSCSLIVNLSNFSVCKWWRDSNIGLSNQVTYENYEIIKDFVSMKDILMFSLAQGYDYLRYKELAKSFMYVESLRLYIKNERSYEDLQQDKLYQNDPLYILERHPELVDLYDSEILRRVKINLLFQLNTSHYELENENQILEVVSNINYRLLLEKK